MTPPPDADALATHCAAGYFAVRPTLRGPWMDPAYVPDELISASSTLVRIGPPCHWLGGVEEELADLGVLAKDLPAALAWLESNTADIEYPNVATRPELVAEFIERFAPDVGLRVLGIGLEQQRVEGFLAEHDRRFDQPDGIVEMLRARRPMAAGAVALGWEPLNVDFGGIFSSWTTCDLQPEIAKRTTFKLNDDGLLSTAADAEAVMAQESVWAGVDSGFWQPFLLVEYPH